jgi:hypothetical protein
MTDKGEMTGGDGKLNKGQGLVAAFRAARIAQRPALKTELRTGRAALRQERLSRIGRVEPPAASGAPPQDAAEVEDIAVAAKPELAPAPTTGTSVFATFLDDAEAPPNVVGVQAVQAPPEPAPPCDAAACDPAPEESAVPAPPIPLSSIGFGPGMMIRMSHLGIESVQELAAADPAWLRGALGDISRLINVELWIASARNACSQAA